MKKIMMIGPVYPFTTGLSYYVGLLYRQLCKKHDVTLYSYSMQYPKFMYKKKQRDYEDDTVKVDDVEYILNSANPFNWISVKRRIKKERPETLILQWLHPYFAPCYWFLTRKLKNTTVLYICHNALPHERFPLDRWLTKTTLSHADYIVAHSQSDAQELQEMLPKSKVEINPHPAYNFFKIKDMTMEEGRNILKIKQEQKVLLFFGLIREYKGLKHLLNAMPRIIEKYPDVKLLIAGDFGKSDNEKFYRDMMSELNIERNVDVYGGHIPITEVEKFFAACDMVVLPYESATQSGVIQVAYSFDKTVLATNVGGLPDVVSDGETGYVVEPQNPDKIADAVIDFYENHKAAVFEEHIREEAYRFSWERMENTIMSMLDN